LPERHSAQSASSVKVLQRSQWRTTDEACWSAGGEPSAPGAIVLQRVQRHALRGLRSDARQAAQRARQLVEAAERLARERGARVAARRHRRPVLGAHVASVAPGRPKPLTTPCGASERSEHGGRHP
jgi:hypothetical protein